ncbi:MAG: 30S ribosomal protein S20 [bacterium]
MAKRIQSAQKQARQAVKHRTHNKTQLSGMRTAVKKALVELSAEPVNLVVAETAVKQAVRKIQKVASKGVIHKRQAARRVARLVKRFQSLRSKSVAASPPAG